MSGILAERFPDWMTYEFPLSGLLPEHQGAVDGLVVIGLIVYLSVISLLARVRAAAPDPST